MTTQSPTAPADVTGDTWIDIAYDILRELNDGHEPYAASVLPMAHALEKRFNPRLDKLRESLARIAELEGAMAVNGEIVICAAIRLPNGKIYRGQRHGDCIRAAREFIEYRAAAQDAEYVEMAERKDIYGDQGFITSRNRYVDRQEGMRLQLAAGIESKSADGRGYRGTTLFSEDLY